MKLNKDLINNIESEKIIYILVIIFAAGLLKWLVTFVNRIQDENKERETKLMDFITGFKDTLVDLKNETCGFGFLDNSD